MNNNIEQWIDIGAGDLISARRIVAILQAEGKTMKTLRDEAYQRGQLITVTRGAKTRAMLLLDSGQLILAALDVAELSRRAKIS